MPNDVNSEEILQKAEQLTPRNEVCPIHHFRAVYILRYDLDEKEVHKRAFVTQFRFIEEGLMKEFAFRIGKRYKFNDKFNGNQEKFAREIYDFIIDYEKHKKTRGLNRLEKSVLNGGDCLVDHIDDYLNEIPFSEKYQGRIKQTEYSRFVRHFSYEFYCNMIGINVKRLLKSKVKAGWVLVDFLATRNLAVRFSNRLRSSFRRQGYITEKEKIFNDQSQNYIRTELNSYLENFLPDYLQDLREEIKSNTIDKEESFHDYDKDKDVGGNGKDSYSEYPGIYQEDEF